jgi:hypothetical protein
MSHRILVFSHAAFNNSYGATTSIREHYKALECLEDYKFIHISKTSTKELLLSRYNQHGISNLSSSICRWSSNIEAVLPAILPWSNNYEEGQGYYGFLGLRDFRQSISKLAWLAYSKNIVSLIDLYQPSLIHLNSLVLLELVPLVRKSRPDIPILSHVREVLIQNLDEKDRQFIQHLDALIPIDYATEHRVKMLVPEYPSDQIYRVQNPFRALPFDGSLVNLFPDGMHVFAIIGQVISGKGVDFVCECFHEANLENTVLIVFGNDKHSYASSLKLHWSSVSSKIIWAGHHDYLFERGVYNKIDVVVRGDLSFRTGRTVYEGLFSGSRLILPGSHSELFADSDLSEFLEKIEMYKSRNKESLIKAFKATQEKLKSDQINSSTRSVNYLSNYDNYREQIRLIYNLFI